MNDPDILSFLLSGQTVSLATWFAGPLQPRQAEDWLPRIQRQVQVSLAGGQPRFNVQLAELIVRYWIGQDVDAGHKILLALLNETRERAMLELCYGQLLIARKCQPAWQHLERGFGLAAHLLEPEDYFLVLKRHELLRCLALSAQPSMPLELNDLLTEARVIGRLRGRVHDVPDLPGCWLLDAPADLSDPAAVSCR